MNTNIGSMITYKAGIVGGRPYLNGTRVPISAIALSYKQGYLPQEIVQQFERLSIAQIYAALAYYYTNQVEIDANIAREEVLYEKLAAEQLQTRKHT